MESCDLTSRRAQRVPASQAVCQLLSFERTSEGGVHFVSVPENERPGGVGKQPGCGCVEASLTSSAPHSVAEM